MVSELQILCRLNIDLGVSAEKSCLMVDDINMYELVKTEILLVNSVAHDGYQLE